VGALRLRNIHLKIQLSSREESKLVIPVLRSMGLLRMQWMQWMQWFILVPHGMHRMFAVVIAMSQEGELLPLARCMERGVRRLRRIHQIYGASQGEFFRRHGHWKYRRHERPADRARGKGGHGDCSTDILIIFEYLPSFFKLEPAGSSLLWLAFLIHFLLGDLG
jgi:hypothetical protein